MDSYQLFRGAEFVCNSCDPLDKGLVSICYFKYKFTTITVYTPYSNKRIFTELQLRILI